MPHSRRKFFKKSLTITLPILAFVVFNPLNVIASNQTITGCENSCQNSCNNACVRTCRYTCNNKCKAVCQEMCEVACTSCKGLCKGSCRQITTVTNDTIIIKKDTIR